MNDLLELSESLEADCSACHMQWRYEEDCLGETKKLWYASLMADLASIILFLFKKQVGAVRFPLIFGP
jgi:hypothetical protein